MADFLGTTGIDNFTGTDDAETISGNAANDVLNGGGGDDIMNGDGGNDTVNGDAGNDIIRITAGIDTVNGGADTDTLFIDYSALTFGAVTIDLRNAFSGGVGKIVNNGITGNITGFETMSRLYGSMGADTVYIGQFATDFTVMLYGGDDKFYGGTLNDRVDGGGGADKLYTGDGVDTLYGGGGADLLNGGASGDDMFGGFGNDTYVVDNGLDFVFEVDNATGGGVDTVNSSVSFQLGSYVERLVLTGTDSLEGIGNGLGNNISGNSAANMLDGMGGNDTIYGMGGDDVIYGGGGNDVINGGGGADQMQGGAGNDVYFVDNMSDWVLEETFEGLDTGGSDLVRSTVSFEMGDFVEKLTLMGTAAIDATGNGLANAIIGNGAANAIYGEGGGDVISGGGGNDQIHGGAGANILTGGAGQDAFFFDVLKASSQRDTVKDFVVNTDVVVLNSDAFTGLATTETGFLHADAFGIGNVAATADTRIFYDPTTGILRYDQDGSGTAYAHSAIALFENKPATLAADDFYVM